MKTDIITAILAINSSAIVNVKKERFHTEDPDLEIDWLEGTTPISLADIKAKQEEIDKL